MPGILFILFLFAGCALSPQIIEVSPSVDVKTMEPNSTTLRVDVTDVRGSDIIGKRGGIYKETSNISTGKNMTANIRRNLSIALEQLGYQVVPKTAPAAAEMIVQITNISYSTTTEKLLNKVNLEIAIDVIAHKNNREFTTGFNAVRKKDYVKVPGIKDNERFVNETLSIVLQNMLNDDDLNSFLDE